MAKAKVAVITGGNTGIGLAVAKGLLQANSSIHLCMACRNLGKAKAAESELRKLDANAMISIVELDTSHPASVLRASKELKKRFNHIDYLFTNAGIMPEPSVDWSAFFKGLFSTRMVHMFATGDGILVVKDAATPEGLQKTFATNVFGHYLLVDELQDCLGGVNGSSQVIWTSSSNAKKEAFSLSDIQHENGLEPYAASKYATDLLSLAMNEKLNKNGIYSHSTCPGLVMTNLTNNIMPTWFWTLVLPIMFLLRLFTSSMTITPENGAHALVWLAEQKPQSLDPMAKYSSRTTFFGKRYTEPVKMNICHQDGQELLRQLEGLKRKTLQDLPASF